MKRLNSLFVLGMIMFITLGMFSCSQDDDFMNQIPYPPQTKTVQVCETRAQANTVLVNYLELVDNKYILNISQAEAEKIGIPATLYEGSQGEIAKTNELIDKLKNDPNTELELTDPQVALKNKSIYEPPTAYALATSGTLTTDDQREVESGLVWAPSGTSGIEFLCRANATITPGYTCKTYSSGSWQSKTKIGTI